MSSRPPSVTRGFSLLILVCLPWTSPLSADDLGDIRVMLENDSCSGAVTLLENALEQSKDPAGRRRLLEGVLESAETLAKSKKGRQCAIKLAEVIKGATDDSSLWFTIADVFQTAEAKNRAVKVLDELVGVLSEKKKLNVKLSRKERKEQSLLDSAIRKANKKLDKLIPWRKTLRELKNKAIGKWLKFAETMIRDRKTAAALAALELVERVDPHNPRAKRLKRQIDQEPRGKGRWIDLTKSRIDNRRNNPGMFSVNGVPGLPGHLRELTKKLQENGVFLPDQKYIYQHAAADADTFVEYARLPPIRRLRAKVVVARPKGWGKVVFKVLADGKLVYESPSIKGGMAPLLIDTKEFPPCRRIRLVIDAAGTFHSDDSVWIEPVVLLVKK